MLSQYFHPNCTMSNSRNSPNLKWIIFQLQEGGGLAEKNIFIVLYPSQLAWGGGVRPFFFVGFPSLLWSSGKGKGKGSTQEGH